ncbi:MAG: modification methylase [Betaproteobacteria bacterium]|nr:modification methylase [Betaproteobacteria bacterium]
MKSASGNTNASLGKARAEKNDEFYTRRESVESELRHYGGHFAGKTVYCNCDDPTVSKFYEYFKNKFATLKLKRLITTCYKNQNPDMFSRYDSERAVSVEYDGKRRTKMLRGDGDFRSDECIRLLRQADIVVTNPPFSLFREYVPQLAAEDKQFLVIGNMNSIGLKEVFKLIIAGKLWLGCTSVGEFTKPDGSTVKMGNVRWFTNLPHRKRNEELRLAAEYRSNESSYTKFDNYDAINVNRVDNIPHDYAGVMGVPISFLEKWNPDQFELVGLIAGNIKGLAGIPTSTGKDGPYINGKLKYSRVLIKQK